MIDQIKKHAKQCFEEIRSIRHHLHRHPELSYAEFETIAFIVDRLKSWKIDVEYPIATTGCIAILKGGKEASQKCVALRADIDALPIQELNEVDYKSVNPGVMHACGHDVHTSCALGAIYILNQLKASWSGTVKVLFQPAEEKLPGGASIMIREGALENPSPACIIGQHVHPPLHVGKIGIRPGAYMASADEIYITVRGKGGHGALPHECVDTVLLASSIVVQVQQLVSRMCDPTIPCVLTFGKINTVGGATNVIPDEIRLEGTFRTMNEVWRKQAHAKIEQICHHVAESMGGSCEVDIHVGYPCLVNDDKTTQQAKQAAIEYLGQENVVNLPIRMTAEDFAYYSQELPACFYRLGTGNPNKGIVAPVHTSNFDIDEEALEIGMGLMAYLAVHQLNMD